MNTSFLNTLDTKNREQFDAAINALQGDVAAAPLSIDPRLRLEYSRRIKEMADDLRSRVNAGLLTWEQAAKEAQETRNLIMEMIRTRSTPLGRAMAERMKSSGKTLNELVAKKATSLFGLKQTLPAFLKCKKIRCMPALWNLRVNLIPALT
ncbi:hypothetical protein [Pantoea ananatis]|uniref:hypothetical protein n=1 Tax=Pantoea ananas TaxID=553 RepID=UPI001FF0C77A|nr:hypothetical protein [Pantoea ananatis]